MLTLAELKGERSKLETEPFDASTTLNDLLTDLEASLKTLELSVDADPTFFDGPVGPVQIEGLGELNDTDKIFITDASLRFKTPFGSPDLVAADLASKKFVLSFLKERQQPMVPDLV